MSAGRLRRRSRQCPGNGARAADQRRLRRRHRQPPGPKAWYQTAGTTPATAAAWRAAATRHPGSWWEDWTQWADQRAGHQVKPPPMGNRRYPAIGDAPGDYVLG